MNKMGLNFFLELDTGGDPVLPEDAGLILDEMEKKRNRFSVIKGGKQ